MLKWLKRGLLSSLFAVAVSGTGWAIDPVDTSQLVNAVTAEKKTREDISPARVAQRIGAGASVTVDYFGPHLVR